MFKNNARSNLNQSLNFYANIFKYRRREKFDRHILHPESKIIIRIVFQGNEQSKLSAIGNWIDQPIRMKAEDF